MTALCLIAAFWAVQVRIPLRAKSKSPSYFLPKSGKNLGLGTRFRSRFRYGFLLSIRLVHGEAGGGAGRASFGGDGDFSGGGSGGDGGGDLGIGVYGERRRGAVEGHFGGLSEAGASEGDGGSDGAIGWSESGDRGFDFEALRTGQRSGAGGDGDRSGEGGGGHGGGDESRASVSDSGGCYACEFYGGGGGESLAEDADVCALFAGGGDQRGEWCEALVEAVEDRGVAGAAELRAAVEQAAGGLQEAGSG